MATNIRTLKTRDIIQLISVIVAAMPFHLFLLFNILYGNIGIVTVIYIILNSIIIFFLYRFMRFLFKSATKLELVKLLVCYEIIPTIIIALLIGSRVSLFMGDDIKGKESLYLYKEE